MTIKILKSRDSATSILRKLGVKPADYNQLITKAVDGQYLIDTDQVVRHLAPPVTTVTTAATVSSLARDLILAGRTNAEVWAALKARFGLDDRKKAYPSWYRWQLRSKGQLSATA